MIDNSLRKLGETAEHLLAKINFPKEYARALKKGTKTVTLRVGPEAGKYKPGETYVAQTYEGTPLNLSVKIDSSIHAYLNDLEKQGIPKRSIASLRRKEGLSDKDLINLIRFSIVRNQETL